MWGCFVCNPLIHTISKVVLGLLRAHLCPLISHAGQNMHHRASDCVNWSHSASIHRVMLILITEADGPARSEQQGWLLLLRDPLHPLLCSEGIALI